MYLDDNHTHFISTAGRVCVSLSRLTLDFAKKQVQQHRRKSSEPVTMVVSGILFAFSKAHASVYPCVPFFLLCPNKFVHVFATIAQVVVILQTKSKNESRMGSTTNHVARACYYSRRKLLC